ncbi:hypothetical protein P879_04333 [Paragonimus westermani]|uniref:Uncharacterized protein n=1 Tax=Paragonimus westermani TaxID=34504 RepID=A0A8T0DMM0_9TREM|nr:hypothetical protein P879_04333 [Paragonimus westermani]
MLLVGLIVPKSITSSLHKNLLTLPPVGLPPIQPWRVNGSYATLGLLTPLGKPFVPVPVNHEKTVNQTISVTNQDSSVSVDQSEVCTPEENLKQIQCLRELPAERYEVLEGEDVQLRCRVAHQRGKTQWRAGNFLLGEFPEYSPAYSRNVLANKRN